MVWLRRVGWGVASLLLLWGLAWLAAPPLLKWQAQVRLSEALGRPVRIDAVQVEPWRLTLTIDGLQIGSAPGAAAADAPLLHIAKLHVDAAAASLWQWAPVIEAIELDGVELRMAHTGDGRYDIDDLIARFTPAKDAPPPGEPQRFALYNLQLRDARIRFDDRPVGRVHQVEALQLAVPFLSNLPAQVDVKVEPRLAFRLGTTRFDTGAQATPFAKSRRADLKLTMGDLDLSPFLPYLPASLPLRLTGGRLAADLNLRFAMPEQGAQTLALQGRIQTRGFAFSDRAGAPMLGWDSLDLALDEVQPLLRRVALDSLQVDGLQAHLRRDAQGSLDWARLGAAGKEAGPPVVTHPASAAASGPSAPTSASTPGWQISLAKLALNGSTVFWQDAAVTPAVSLQLDDSSLSAEALAWPHEQPVVLRLATTLRSSKGTGDLGRLAVEGRAGLNQAQLGLELSNLSLDGLAPYLAEVLQPEVVGALSVKADLDWAAAGSAAERLQLRASQVKVDQLRLTQPVSAKQTPAAGRGTTELAAFKQLALNGLVVDMPARSLVLDRLSLQQPNLGLVRNAEGRWNVQDWPAPAAATTGPAAAPARVAARPAAGAPAPPPWRIAVKDLLLQGGQLAFSDALAGQARSEDPLRLQLSGLRLAVQNLAWQGDRNTPPMRVQLDVRVGAGPGADDKTPATGLIAWQGQVGVVPTLARGKLRVERLAVHLFEPYFGDRLPLALVRAEAGYLGELTVQQEGAGYTIGSQGDVLLGDVQVHARNRDGAPGDELLSWQRLALDGVSFGMPAGGRPKLEIREAALSDFYSRLVITEQGRFNLQDVAAAPASAASAPGNTDVAAGAAPTPVTALPPAASAAAAAAAAASAGAATAGGGPPLDFGIGKTRLVNGRVDFTDRFVRPNYSAALSELNGQLGAFRSGTREMASLELRGRAAGTALLDISGQLNPTAEPLALDIRAKATDLELAPLSPYAGKYAGYAIERGKLSMDVSYKIDPDGKLDAKNQVILNQLTFGDKIESAQATKLPVLLAVALLKDRHGVIDIDLPVSGSLTDPQFSVGGIILKVIVNLLAKALTAPFALLAGGGSDDLSLVEFRPGTASLVGSGHAALDKVAKALGDRPALKMTVTGAADPAAEAEAYRREALETRLLAERRRELLRAANPAVVADAASAAASASAPSAPPPALTASDRERLLRLVYKQTELPNKPKNLIGFTKDIPAAEMETLLKTALRVNEDAMRELALQRGLAVRDALIARGLPSERLFLAAPKLRAAGEGEGPWTPRVQLSLSTN